LKAYKIEHQFYNFLKAKKLKSLLLNNPEALNPKVIYFIKSILKKIDLKIPKINYCINNKIQSLKMSAEKRLEELRSHPGVQKRIAEEKMKRQLYNMLVEINREEHMVSWEYYSEFCRHLEGEVEKEIENMADEEAKSCYQVEFEKIMNGECGDEVYNGKSEFKFVADGCGCEFFKNSKEHDECRSDKNGENWICGDCYQGEYDKECAHCGEFCPDEYNGDIDGDEEPLCEDCFEQLEKCEMCGDPTDAEPWKDVEGEVLHCSDCKDKRMREIAEAIAQIMPIWEKAKGIAEEIEVIKQMKAEVEMDGSEVVAVCFDGLLVGNRNVVEGLTEADRRVMVLKPEFKCDNCDELSCGEVKFFPDDKEKSKKICVPCFDEEEVWFYKCVACNVEADQRNLPKCEDAEYCCECCWKQEGGKNSCECPVCVANPKPEPEPDEEFKYGGVRNDTICNIFGGEVVFNKLKALAQAPDDEKDMRVVWKFGYEHLSLYVYLDGEPFLDAVYPRNHSCDMFYHLQELKEFVEQVEEEIKKNNEMGLIWGSSV